MNPYVANGSEQPIQRRENGVIFSMFNFLLLHVVLILPLHLSDNHSNVISEIVLSSLSIYKGENRNIFENSVDELSFVYEFSELVLGPQFLKGLYEEFIIIQFDTTGKNVIRSTRS